MTDWQNIVVVAAVALAASYVLRAALAACGLLGARAQAGCGGCSGCPSARAGGRPSGETVQLVSLTLPEIK